MCDKVRLLHYLGADCNYVKCFGYVTLASDSNRNPNTKPSRKGENSTGRAPTDDLNRKTASVCSSPSNYCAGKIPADAKLGKPVRRMQIHQNPETMVRRTDGSKFDLRFDPPAVDSSRFCLR